MKAVNARKTFLLSLIILWCIATVMFYWIPYLSEISAGFKDNVGSGGMCGFASTEDLIDKLNKNTFFVISGIICIICILCSLVICMISYKRNAIRYIGIGVIIQTVFSLLIKLWNNYCMNNVKIESNIPSRWLIIAIIACIIICILYNLNYKVGCTLLGIATFLQVLNIIGIVQLGVGNLTSVSIRSIIFQCISAVTIYVLYWPLLVWSFRDGYQR